MLKSHQYYGLYCWMRCKQRKPNKVNLFCCFLFDYIRCIEFVYCALLLSVITMYIIILYTYLYAEIIVIEHPKYWRFWSHVTGRCQGHFRWPEAKCPGYEVDSSPITILSCSPVGCMSCDSTTSCCCINKYWLQ
jgi:hypothetical protein